MEETVSVRTERLILTPLSDEQMLRLIEAEGDAHMKNAYRQMRDGAASQPDQRLWYTAWRIALSDGTPVGDLCFKGPKKDGAVEIGYGVDEPFRNCGYAAEAVGAAIRWAFMNEPALKCVTAETEAENAASQRVLEKLGFVPSGEGEEGPRFVKTRQG